MALSDKELKEITYLARINVKEESFSSLKKELEQILTLFEELNEADTSSVEAMSHPLDLSQPTNGQALSRTQVKISILDSYGYQNRISWKAR